MVRNTISKAGGAAMKRLKFHAGQVVYVKRCKDYCRVLKVWTCNGYPPFYKLSNVDEGKHENQLRSLTKREVGR